MVVVIAMFVPFDCVHCHARDGGGHRHVRVLCHDCSHVRAPGHGHVHCYVLGHVHVHVHAPCHGHVRRRVHLRVHGRVHGGGGGCDDQEYRRQGFLHPCKGL